MPPVTATMQTKARVATGFGSSRGASTSTNGRTILDSLSILYFTWVSAIVPCDELFGTISRMIDERGAKSEIQPRREAALTGTADRPSFSRHLWH